MRLRSLLLGSAEEPVLGQGAGAGQHLLGRAAKKRKRKEGSRSRAPGEAGPGRGAVPACSPRPSPPESPTREVIVTAGIFLSLSVSIKDTRIVKCDKEVILSRSSESKGVRQVGTYSTDWSVLWWVNGDLSVYDPGRGGPGRHSSIPAKT